MHSRVEEIKQLTSRLPWRYCPTDDNAADLLTRGISAQAYLGNQLWDAGPAWLPYRERWPTWEFSQSTLQMSPEYADDKPMQTTTVSSLQCSEVPGIHRVINATDYSTYLKLRVTAYTGRFIDNCRRQVASRVTSSLTTIEIHDAEKRWLKSCQATQFQDEIANMQTNSRNSRLPLVKQLRLYLGSFVAAEEYTTHSWDTQPSFHTCYQRSTNLPN